MKTLLWVGDAGCPSGFARASHEILDTLRFSYDVHVLALNYLGDPVSGPLSDRLYPAFSGGDVFGTGRLLSMCHMVEPDVIVIQQDGWNIPAYMRQLAKSDKYRDTPVIAAVAVDGINFEGGWLKDVSHTVFWTQFALAEARKGGYTGPATVIPLGVDTDAYKPADQRTARTQREIEPLLDMFIVGNVNRNQPRKRWDLTIRYFSAWVKSKGITDAWLYLHAAPTGDTSVNVPRLAEYYGVLDRLALLEPEAHRGVDEDQMQDTYNCFDVQISTTQGEGFGLTTFEGMACGVPQIVPDWSALGDLTRGAALLIPCPTTAIGPPYVNVIGGVADETAFVEALHAVYTDKTLRSKLSALGLARAREDRFRWANIGEKWSGVVDSVTNKLRAVR